ncbi:MAG TPA: hypothetical protein VKM55_25280 [Candidatus Lokiarchaeia archaeon]|nr:hypothetical protein [Candidatus Lokiarchaeia archaeon]
MIPKIDLETLQLSRMLCGTNQFVGISHTFGFHRVLDPGLVHRSPFSTFYYMHKFKDVRNIAEIMIYLAQEHGINACVSSPRESIYDAIQLTEKETGTKFHWLCTPSGRHTVPGLASDIMVQIKWCADHGVSVCMPHRDYTDKHLDIKKNVIDGYPEIAARIRDAGMIPGLSSHYVETIKAVEDNQYDAPVIIQPLNMLGFQSNTEPEILETRIKETNLQIINIKPMAAGRLRPTDGIEYCLQRLKPNDFIAVGFGDIEYAKEDAKIVEELMTAVANRY